MPGETDDLQANPPLTEATFCILLSLAAEPKHGYAIMKDVQALSDGRVVLSTGTLYGALKRQLEQGWIRRLNGTGQSAAGSGKPGRQRKSYALTRLGWRVLDAEVSRLQRLVSIAGLRTAGGRA